LNPTATLTVTGAEFWDNKAQFGGALAILPGATATVRGNLITSGHEYSYFRDNSATHSGGAIYNLGSLNVYETEIDFNFIPQTITANGYGGAIASLGTLTIRNSFFLNNQGRFGGGLYIAAGVGSSRADTHQARIDGNEAGGTAG